MLAEVQVHSAQNQVFCVFFFSKVETTRLNISMGGQGLGKRTRHCVWQNCCVRFLLLTLFS